MLGNIRLRLFGISLDETTVAKRGFLVSDEGVRENLEKVGRIFVEGYHAALLDDNPQTLALYLNQEIEEAYRGFAFEGAGMGLALLDMLTPWAGSRIQRFLDGPGNGHYYMIHVGVGWAMARLHRGVGVLKRLDPVVRWLAVEGYGFHEAYFYTTKTVDKQERPRQLTGYAQRAFDQGIGRCLWFVRGSDVEHIATTIDTFPTERHPDLWAGVGLSSAYAGGVDADTLNELAVAAGPHRPQLAQGTTFAVKTRHRAGNPTAHTDIACQILCGQPPEEVVKIFDAAEPTPNQNWAEPTLAQSKTEPAYEIWRRNIQVHFTRKEVYS